MNGWKKVVAGAAVMVFGVMATGGAGMTSGQSMMVGGASALFGAPERAQAVQFVSLTNLTGKTISHLYVSLAADPRWGSDKLGDGVMPTGMSKRIDIDEYPTDSCMFDVMVTVDGEQDWTVGNIDLCSLQDVTFTEAGGQILYIPTAG